MDYWVADQAEIGMVLMEEKLSVERIVVHAIEKVNENLPDDAKITIPEAQGQNRRTVLASHCKAQFVPRRASLLLWAHF